MSDSRERASPTAAISAPSGPAGVFLRILQAHIVLFFLSFFQKEGEEEEEESVLASHPPFLQRDSAAAVMANNSHITETTDRSPHGNHYSK